MLMFEVMALNTVSKLSSPSLGGRGCKVRVVCMSFALTLALSRNGRGNF
jgi:hypothetical protein